MITAERLRQLFDYAPDTGVFVRRVQLRGPAHIGRSPGTVIPKNRGKSKYLVIFIDRKRYQAARLVWLYMTGEWPKGDVDHIDGNGLNNSWSNLRDSTPSQNGANARLSKRNTSGYKGVTWDRRRRNWQARIMVNGERHQIGSFPAAEDAHLAYAEAARAHFGKFARPEKTT